MKPERVCALPPPSPTFVDGSASLHCTMMLEVLVAVVAVLVVLRMRLRDMPVWQHIAKKVWRDAAAAAASSAADRLSSRG